MIVWLCAIFLVVGFIIVSHFVGLIDKCKQVFVVSGEAVSLLQDSTIDDLEQERGVQRCAIKLLQIFVIVTALSALSVVTPFLVVYVASLVGAVSLDAVIELSLSWEFILLLCVASAVYYLVKKK